MVRGRRGFSIPELLIVMFVLTSLVAGAIVGLKSVKAKGQVTRTLKDVHAVSSAMIAFNDDLGVWPQDKDGIKDLITRPQDMTNYNGVNVEADLWRGPYLQMTTDDNGYPINPFGGRYYTRFNCNGDHDGDGNDDCEYGVVITNVPKERARDIDSKLDGAVDEADGNCLFGDAYQTYETPGAGRVNVFVRLGVE